MDFNTICKKIKNIEIQGATNIAIAGLKAYSLKKNKKSIKKLISLRPTEPTLVNTLKYAQEHSIKEALNHFKESQDKINKYGFKIIKKIIFTHCHSSTVISLLKYAKDKGKKFEVFNTETRPLYQGRKTAKELAKLNIKVSTVIDSAAAIALEKTEVMKKVDIFLIGADAIFKNGDVINKVGSGMFAEIAFYHKIPVYIVTDSWKFSPRNVKIELRSPKEIWKRLPRKVKVKNPSFEIIKAKYITGIISELGILKPKEFVEKISKEKWMKN